MLNCINLAYLSISFGTSMTIFVVLKNYFETFQNNISCKPEAYTILKPSNIVC